MTATATGTDTLLLDLPAARRLAGVLAGAAEEVITDQIALGGMLDRASTLLRSDRTGALVPLAAARRGFEDLAADLRGRIDLVDRTGAGLDGVDHLAAQLDAWHRAPGDEGRAALREALRGAILRLVDGDAEAAERVERAMRGGRDAREAFAHVASELAHEARVRAVMAGFDLDETEAAAMIARVDADLVVLALRGFDEDESLAALTIIENFGLELGDALVHVDATDDGLLEVVGRMVAAQGLGVTFDEFGALAGLEANFAVFDTATGGAADERVSTEDLRHVVAHPWRFTPAQVAAAQAILDQPELRNRLDTAHAETGIFGGAGFGSTEPGDGLIAEVDLRSFMLKAQLHTILGDHADAIDIAADPGGVVDGFRSENDFRAFIADNPQLPASVLAAAEVALEAGWFDESWFQEHKDELAMGAALLAAGVAVVATGGAASMLLVVGTGALAAGGTTLAVNLATGAPALDEAFANAVKGGFIGAGVHTVAAGITAYGAASTGVARVAAISGATSGAADVVANGGIDLLLDEDHEAGVHALAEHLGTAAGGVDLVEGLGEWTTRRMATFDTVEEQLAALSDRVSRQKQLRHVEGSSLHRHGGYFEDTADAQRVLDAVHDGSAEVLGITRGQDLLVRYDGVVGTHVSFANHALEVLDTTMFTIKGTAKPSVVPTRPGRTA